MNTQKTLGIESFLVVLEQLARSGNWLALCNTEQIRLQRRGQSQTWTPFTAVVAELTSSQIILTEDERLSAIDNGFVTTVDQILRIIDAEDGQNGYSGYDHTLRRRIEELALLCAQA